MKVSRGAYLIAYVTAKGGWGSVELEVKKRCTYDAFKAALLAQIRAQTVDTFIVMAVSRVAKGGWL